MSTTSSAAASPTAEPDSTGLRAMHIDCTLDRSPGRSRTRGVIDRSVTTTEANGVPVHRIRAVDHDIATGVRPDRTEHGCDVDERPALPPGSWPPTSSSSAGRSGSATTAR